MYVWQFTRTKLSVLMLLPAVNRKPIGGSTLSSFVTPFMWNVVVKWTCAVQTLGRMLKFQWCSYLWHFSVAFTFVVLTFLQRWFFFFIVVVVVFCTVFEFYVNFLIFFFVYFLFHWTDILFAFLMHSKLCNVHHFIHNIAAEYNNNVVAQMHCTTMNKHNPYQREKKKCNQ